MLPESPSGSAASRPETHARHALQSGPPYSLDSALHLARYAWVDEHIIKEGCIAVDLGCGTGYGVELLARQCGRVVGVDLDPAVTELKSDHMPQNTEFFCADACQPGLADRIGVTGANVETSMETIEHLEDYFSYLENAIELMTAHGTLVVGTPNRTLTYNRYEHRRHMDSSHVQEFTPVSLERTLLGYFEEVDMFFEYVPGFWRDSAGHSHVSTVDKLKNRTLRALARVGVRSSTHQARTYMLEDITFVPAASDPSLALEAFALLAVCRSPRRIP